MQTFFTNRKQLQAPFGPPQFMNQVHGDEVLLISKISEERPTCDALLTIVSGIALAVRVADCIPLLLSSKQVVAAVHVGRAGLVNNIALITLGRMRQLGATSIHAILGPSICGKCYEVPQDLADEIVALKPASRCSTRSGTPSLDLPAGLIVDLKSQGVTYEASTICTFEDEKYFSYRRGDKSERFAGMITL